MFNTRNIVLGLVSAVAMMTSASAQAGSMPFMPRGQTVGAPFGFAQLCLRDAQTCGVPANQIAQLEGALGLAPTSSVGAVSAHDFAKPAAATVSDAEDGLRLITLETVKAWTPAAVEDFVPAGQLRPAVAVAAPETRTVAPTALAWDTRTERDQLKLLNQVNQLVNRTVKKASDLELYGQLEYWSLPRLVNGKLYGDCEDYALEKRRQLLAAGVPDSALSMVVAVTARGESHAVLAVSLRNGDVVLDNLTPWATPWGDLNYQWIERQIPGTAQWTTVS